MSPELVLSAEDHRALLAHLFPGDRDEHGAIVLAGLHRGDRLRLLGRECHLLGPDDFIPGEFGYRQIAPAAVARLGNRAASEQLAFVSLHSHPGASTSVALSPDDRAGHRRVFPHLLDIVNGPPVVGAALGTDSIAGEVWSPGAEPTQLAGLRVIGRDLRLKPHTPYEERTAEHRFDRQARMFGGAGQAVLRELRVGIVGLGGGGSIISEQLAHLGVGSITAIDFDVVKEHNLSRIVGATAEDATARTTKVEVAERLAGRIDPTVGFEALDGDIADQAVAARLAECDFIFLATDSITSRLVANAIVHSHFIPMIQIGAKVDLLADGRIESVYVAIRPVLPARGCLDCAGLIDPHALQHEGTTEEERNAQNYLGLPEIIDPSVITLNGVAASVATNTMLMMAVGLAEPGLLAHRIFDACHGTWQALQPERRDDCVWCGANARSRLGRGDAASLPVRLTSLERTAASERGFWAWIRGSFRRGS